MTGQYASASWHDPTDKPFPPESSPPRTTNRRRCRYGLPRISDAGVYQYSFSVRAGHCRPRSSRKLTFLAATCLVTATDVRGADLPPRVILAGMWRALPGIVNSVAYVSVGTNAGYSNIDLTLSSVITTPRGKVERAESYGKYIQRKTTRQDSAGNMDGGDWQLRHLPQEPRSNDRQ